MTEPLKDCPFCGGGAHRMKHSAGLQGTTGYDQWHGVSCAACNACVGASDRRFRTPAEAIAAWNTRTPQPTQPQAGALTQAQVVEAFCKQPHPVQFVTAFDQGVRFAEKHHGIKGGQHGAE